MIRLSRLCAFAAAAVLLFIGSARAQVALVTVKSTKALLDDVKYLMEAVDQKDAVAEFDAAIQMLTGNKGLDGLDQTKPFGLYVTQFKAEELQGDPPVVFFVPITKEKAFLDLLGLANIDVGEAKAGKSTPLGLPNGQTWRLRFAHGHAYIAMTDKPLADLPAPAKFLTPENKNNLVTASLRFDGIPKDLRTGFIQGFMQGVDASFESNKERLEGESAAVHRVRLAYMQSARNTLKNLVEDSASLSLSLILERNKGLFGFDMTMRPRKGSTLAKDVAAWKPTPHRFARLGRGQSAVQIVFKSPVPEYLRKEAKPLFDEAARRVVKEVGNQKERELFNELIKIGRDALQKMDTLEGAVVLFGPYQDGKLAVVMAGSIKEGKRFDAWLRRAAKLDPTKIIKIDHAKIGADSVHYIVGKEDLDEKFGKANLCFVLRDDLFILSGGSNSLAAMRQTLPALAGKPALSPPFAMDVSLVRMNPFLEETTVDKELIDSIFVGKNKNKDHIWVNLQGGDSLRIRYVLDIKVIAAFAKQESRK